MTAWATLIRAALPYVADIARAAIPAFTSRSGGEQPEQLVQKQIAELQWAVTRNAESVRVLGQQLQDTIQAIDAAATAMEQERRRHRRLLAMCIGLALLSLLVSGVVAFSVLR